MPDLSEREITEKAIAGDTRAFRLLVEKHQAFAFSLSYRFLGNTDDAKDVTQEAFVRLWKNLPKYRFEIKITTWLYKIVTNLCLDQLRSRRRRQLQETDQTATEISDPSASDRALLNEEFRNAILNMADALTPKQKAVFILRDIVELSVEEVCEILAMSPGNIKSNLYYARLKMSELIKKYYGEKKTASL